MDTVPSQTADSSLKRRIICTLILLLLTVALVDWWHERAKERRYDTHILRAATDYGVDPALVKALVWRESKFNPKARGKAGEIGLMQIRSLPAQEWARAEKRQRAFDGTLLDPETNLRVGTWYLSKLLKRYVRTDNPVPYALADYNAGRSNVLRWNKGAAETNSAVFVTRITFPGTQQYIQMITRQRAKYITNFKSAVVSRAQADVARVSAR
jgi:soluble lytic murein transglycosylase